MRIYTANSIHQEVKMQQRTLKLAQCRYGLSAPNQSLHCIMHPMLILANVIQSTAPYARQSCG